MESDFPKEDKNIPMHLFIFSGFKIFWSNPNLQSIQIKNNKWSSIEFLKKLSQAFFDASRYNCNIHWMNIPAWS